jgi:tetratricopeptide (TPR) repeat protein
VTDHSTFDVFLSYHHADGALATRLHDALTTLGLSVFFDEAQIESFESITGRLRQGIGRSKALLAVYSVTYPSRRACQFELTAAFVAAQRLGADPADRVLVVNPERGVVHIQPVELRDARFEQLSADDGDDVVAAIAARIRDHVATLDGSLAGAAPLVPPRWHGMRPSAATRFVGRQPAMWEIHSALHAGDMQPMTGAVGPCVAAVCGLGGIGKTLLAQEYALRFGAAFPGGVFWLRAGGDVVDADADMPAGDALEAARIAQLRSLAIGVGLDPTALPTPDHVTAALADVLGRGGEPFLWIVDDVPSGLDADALRAWFAPHPLGRSLITTRSRAYGAFAATIEPSQLTHEDALTLLSLHRAPAGAQELEAARQLVGDLGCHALAVDVTGGALARSSQPAPYEALRTELADQTDDVLEFAAELADVLPTNHSPSIAATLLGSIDAMGEDAQDLLRIASVLAVAPIPAAFAAQVVAVAEELEELPHRRVSAARAELQRASLAETAEDGAADVVHALVSRTVRFRERDSRRLEALRSGAIIAFDVIGSKADDDPAAAAMLPALIPHARQLAPAIEHEPTGLTLLELLAHYDDDDGAYASAHELMQRVVHGRITSLGPAHPDTLTAQATLAYVLWSMGRYAESCAIEEQVLAILRETVGERDLMTLTVMNNLGESYRALGESSKALALAERVLELRRELLGPEHQDTLIAVGNVAEALRAQDKLDEIVPLTEEVLDWRLRTLGETHPDTLVAKSALALTLRTIGRVSEALTLDEEVLEARQATLGEEHPETLAALLYYVKTLATAGEYGRAQALGSTLVDASARVLGETHPSTLRALSAQAATEQHRNEHADAAELLERVRAAESQTLGDEHPATLNTRARLAAIRAQLGDEDEARRLIDGVHAAALRVSEDERPDALRVLGNLAIAHNMLHEQDQACEIGAQTVELMERHLGPEHPRTLVARANLAAMTWDRGDREAAERMLAQVVAEMAEVLGTEHRDFVDAWLLHQGMRRKLDEPS